MRKTIIVLFLLFSAVPLLGQVRDYELGTRITAEQRGNIYGGYFDYSDPEAVNIRVSVWGFVEYPGRYLVPDYTTVMDLLSYAGGPTDDSNLDELRLYRIEDNVERMIPINFNDLMWEEDLENKYRSLPQIKPGDIFVIPGEPRMYFLDWFGIGLSVFSALISLTILIITIQE
jgi:hypothetical protein